MTRAYNTATTQQNTGGAVAGVTAGKNAVINGAFDYWQRGTTAAISPSGFYIADRWRYYRPTTGSTGSRSTDVPTGFTYSAKIQRDSGNTATNDIYFGQALENVDSVRFVSQTVTLSFWAKAGANFSGASSQIIAQIQTGVGTNQAMFDFTGGTAVGGLQTITTTWTKYSVTTTIASGITQVGVRFYYTPVGTAGADDSFLITGVQLETGSVITPFSRAGGTIQGELAACQRYYFRNTGASIYFGSGGIAGDTVTCYTQIKHPVTMRVAPTALDYSLLLLQRISASFNVTSATIAAAAPDVTLINTIVASGLTATTQSYMLMAQNNAGAYIGLSAEL
jgi:hypothetical protein